MHYAISNKRTENLYFLNFYFWYPDFCRDTLSDRSEHFTHKHMCLWTLNNEQKWGPNKWATSILTWSTYPCTYAKKLNNSGSTMLMMNHFFVEVFLTLAYQVTCVARHHSVLSRINYDSCICLSHSFLIYVVWLLNYCMSSSAEVTMQCS